MKTAEDILIPVPSDTEMYLFSAASILSGYPEREFWNELSEDYSVMDKNLYREISPEHWDVILGHITHSDIEKFQSEYIRLFDTSKEQNPLYETEYGRNRILSKGNDLADIAGFYSAYGMEVNEIDMPDHISIELEFYFQLLLRQKYLDETCDANGSEIVFNTRREFMKSHLGRFYSQIKQRPNIAGNEFYSAIFSWIFKLVEREIGILNVVPETIEWVAIKQENEEANCGGPVTFNVNR